MRAGSGTKVETADEEITRIEKRMALVASDRLAAYRAVMQGDPSWDQARRLRYLREWARTDKAFSAEWRQRFEARCGKPEARR
jgi:hypothetical protein